MTVCKMQRTFQRQRVVLAVMGALIMAPAAAEPLLSVPNSRDADLSRWEENQVEVGALGVSESSYKFGEWTGLRRDGAYGIVNFNWLSRNLNGDSSYWRAYGSSLNRRLSLGLGNQGRFDLSFDYQQVPHFETESARFLHEGLGGTNLTLPAGFTRFASPVAAGPGLLPRLNGFAIGQQRDIYRAGLGAAFSSAWDFKVNYREDRRDGNKITGAAISGFNATLMPYPLDEKTQQAEALLSYAQGPTQLQFGYYYSAYTNDVRSLTWQNPYNTANAPLGSMSLSPSNEFHQVNANAGYNFTKWTRLAAHFSLGRATQDEPFLPFTVNPTFASPALPRESLDGRIDHVRLGLNFTTRPLTKMGLKLAYEFADNDTKTPRDQYSTVRLDATNPLPFSVGTAILFRTNVPVSTQENKFIADADYEVAKRTYVRGIYERKNVGYKGGDRGRTNDDKLGIELRGPLADYLSGSVAYSHTRRTGTRYDKNQFYEASYHPTYVANTRAFDNHPSTRQFLYSDYGLNRLKASGNWVVSETVTLQAAAEHFQQKHRGPDCGDRSNPNVDTGLGARVLPDTCLGRTRLDGQNYTVDAQWQPDPGFTAYGFYTYSRYGTDQRSRQWVSPPGGLGQAVDPAREWTVKSDYRDDVLGAGLKWQAHESLELGSQYVYSDGRGRHDLSAGTGVAPQPLPVPDARNRLHSLQLFAKWRYSKALTLRFNYWYEELRTTDWAYDNLTPISSGGVLLTGQESPRYRNHVIGVSVAVEN
jgi:MtrB/PioB family decaheme-associated outer membrane protein